MIDRQKLLADLKPLLRELEADLRARCDEVVQINADLTKEYEEARAADRVGVTFEEWRADLITQVAVAWVLSCVFVRFLEDNSLISPPRISGPLHGSGEEQGWTRARDERDAFFRAHATQTDRDYLLAVFDDLARLPGTKDVFGPHNPVNAYRNWLSGDAAQKLIEFFQKIDADGTGEIVHDFADDAWDTRFLGDLYQDLSETARKKYALLQTPIFVEEFILERTLEPAINEFGLKDFKMIDPACGSGHFLLGSFARILNHWRKAEPGTNDRELVNRALASIHGVDLNPYAVAIARFRLLLAAMRECQITLLKDAPSFQFNLACGDSLLHGERPFTGGIQITLDPEDPATRHVYTTEDRQKLIAYLKHGQYHAVVANPPYITPKDPLQNQSIRARYSSCHMKYALSVPFMERIFDLAVEGTKENGQRAGFTGQITSNSFMKREFGKRLIEFHIRHWDLTHVIDTSGAYIPGHGTPTVILFGRNRRPVVRTVRAVMGIKGEPAVPADSVKGLVWSAILDQVDRVNSQSVFVSVNDTPREQFGKHPWSIGGGGAAELKLQIEDACESTLDTVVVSIGPPSFTGIDEMFLAPAEAMQRVGVPAQFIRPLCIGEQVRDWDVVEGESAFVPYGNDQELVTFDPDSRWAKRLWPYRPCSEGMVSFARQTRKECGEIWWSWYRWIPERYRTPLSIVFAFVATHNHFVLDRGGKVFNRSAPVINLPSTATEDDYLSLLGLLNSSTACFWMKQVFYPKATSTGDISTEKGKPEANRYEFTATGLEGFPIPKTTTGPEAGLIPLLSKAIMDLAGSIDAVLPAAVLDRGPTGDSAALHAALSHGATRYQQMRQRMIALQEELDWECYRLFGLSKEGASSCILAESTQGISPEARPFLWQSDECPSSIPPLWRDIYARRRHLTNSSSSLSLVETIVFKRPWWGRQGVYGRLSRDYDGWRMEALAAWLLCRLETYFDLDGRMNDQKIVTAKGDLHEPRLTSVAKVTGLAKQDKDFMQVAELYAGRMDFDVANLVGDLVAAESVPCLPLLRYKPSGMDKRDAWERTWGLQRLEDAIDALFDVQRLKKIESGKAQESLRLFVAVLRIEEQAKAEVLREAANAAGYIAEAAKQNLDLASELILKPVTDAAKRAKQRAVGDIPVPPKYTSADFLSSNVWRLRGKLDVPKERWVSFPHCEGEDGTLIIAWAGYDHLQLARAIAERYEYAKEHEGRKLVPLLACIGQQIPWLKQWHNDLDPTYGTRMGDYFEEYLTQEAKALGLTVAEVMAWMPPNKPKGRGRKKVKT
jgi:hypothetical protein